MGNCAMARATAWQQVAVRLVEIPCPWVVITVASHVTGASADLGDTAMCIRCGVVVAFYWVRPCRGLAGLLLLMVLGRGVG